ncbi:MAG: polyribonucleotide nucleotidyltransferase [Parcubacteria group bacterium]|nr:polyribonucleotide nucleotidyltransferase [Parcubacteria group bacterium]
METPITSLTSVRVSTTLAGRTLTLSTGGIAEQATASVIAQYGETVVLATVTHGQEPRSGIDFFPLMVDFEEKFYAAGKIKGSRFIKREGRPSDEAILTSRLIDRPLRPLFPQTLRNDVQVIVSVLSADLVNDPDQLAITAASSALLISGLPFEGPVAGMRIGKKGEALIVNPTYQEVEEGELDLVVASRREGIVMVEAGAKEVIEAKVIEAINLAHRESQPVLDLQTELREKVSPTEVTDLTYLPDTDVIEKEIEKTFGERIRTALVPQSKGARNVTLDELKEEAKERWKSDERFSKEVIENGFTKVAAGTFRTLVISEGKRPDGRAPHEIRPISVAVGILPRTHGSALFTRGETQVLTLTTLGSTSDEQIIDSMDSDTTKRYIHHYNFPPFSVGETGVLRGPGRREIGHGALAERALIPVIPPREEFPYTLRLVSETLASNGSSSMASVCGSTLSLMDAGVPIKNMVSGVAMGLVIDKEGRYQVLTDIQGIEDHEGDMDFKVAGTEKGITALQLDIKVSGLTTEILTHALDQAQAGRLFILGKMREVISAPRPELSRYAPRIVSIKINPAKIRNVIGRGGETINKIIAETDVEIDIEDDGTVLIASTNPQGSERAIEWIKRLTFEPVAGEVYEGRVTRTMNFGAFVELVPGIEGLVHISEMAPFRVRAVEDVVKIGDVVKVKVVEVDSQGRYNLSMKQVPGTHPSK